ncbi:hypothetical protein [Nonomuraea typhae]|uniref:DUF320 domain-containing protein n=1 Tax=Nonomuraea typhae TaxID=2603600 RepID=A0ABW7YRU9_9ACTN|nr:hypothetical protein [Nonomuraea typhae]
MIKKLCATGAIVAAVAGATLVAAPAHADSRNTNGSSNSGSSQSGNNFNEIGLANVGDGGSTNVNNLGGNAVTSTNGGITVVYIFE